MTEPGAQLAAADIEACEPACRNCGLPIMRKDRSPTGWTHGRKWAVPRSFAGWQGMRCPGMLCGAEPVAEVAAGER